jgi:transposase
MQPYTKRQFEKGKHWVLWNAQELMALSDEPPRFWDDETLKDVSVDKMRWYCGVEVHKKVLVLALYGLYQQIPVLGPILMFTTDQEGYQQLAETIKPFQPYRFLLETTGVYHFMVVWQLQQIFPSGQICVMNSYDVAKYLKRTRKSDKVDAIRLAQLARYDELIKKSYCPTQSRARLREYARLRAREVSEEVKVKNRIKKELSIFGFEGNFDFKAKSQTQFLVNFLKSSENLAEFYLKNAPKVITRTKKQTKRKEKTEEDSGSLPESKMQNEFLKYKEFNPCPEVRAMILLQFQLLTIRTSEREAIEAIIHHQIQNDPEFSAQIALLEQVPGLGVFSAISLITEIGDLSRFQNSSKFLAYCGIAPSGGTSGRETLNAKSEKIVTKDRPNRKCNPILKLMLLQAAGNSIGVAIKGFETNDIVSYAKKMIVTSKTYFKQEFKVAAKLGRKIFHCLKDQQPYLPYLEATTPKTHPKINRIQRLKRHYQQLDLRFTELEQQWLIIYTQLRDLGVEESHIQSLGQYFPRIQTILGGE